MSGETKLFLGLRKCNGQIGYMSEGINIPEFFDLIQYKVKGATPVLINFYPIIEKIHAIHNKHEDKDILLEYNSMFNYWQDSKSYNDRNIKIPKSEYLSQSSNNLISKIQLRLQDNKSEILRESDSYKKLRLIDNIKSDCDIYIDTMLCLIHSKASLEIDSFKRDAVLRSYCCFLRDIVWSIYAESIGYSTFTSKLKNESLLYSLAFNKSNELNSYIDAAPEHLSQLSDLRVSYMDMQHSECVYDERLGQVTKLTITWRDVPYQEINIAKTFRNLMYKVNSISSLLEKLKEGDVEWDSSNDFVDELIELINQKVLS